MPKSNSPGLTRRHKKGQATLEIGLILMLLVPILLVGVVTLGIGVHDYNSFDKAMRESGRSCSEQANPTDAVTVARSVYVDEMKDKNLSGNPGDINVTFRAPDGSPTFVAGGTCQVKGTYQWEIPLGGDGHLTWVRTSTFRIQAYGSHDQ